MPWSFSFSLALPSSVCFRQPAAELVVAAQVDIIKIKSVKEPFFLDLSREVLYLSLDLPLTHVLRPNQGSQGRLMLNPSRPILTATTPSPGPISKKLVTTATATFVGLVTISHTTLSAAVKTAVPRRASMGIDRTTLPSSPWSWLGGTAPTDFS
jgi:hypothetical protein